MLPLFENAPRRLAVLQQELTPSRHDIKIAVYRNHSFEMIGSVLNSFLNFSGYAAEFIYSDYDDSLNFQYHPADIQVIWVDTNRYNTQIAEDFLKERAAVLREQSKAPIMILYTGDNELSLSDATTDCYAFHMDSLLRDLTDSAYDEKKEAYSGTRLSNKACLKLAQTIGLKYIPAVLETPLKAIVVDLDNTLYSGILGEDGIAALKPYNEVQQQLKELKQQGFFLCVASKNEESDVRELFKLRKDFVLRWEDFTAVQINWDAKAENIQKLARTLNIGTDAILFLDDNPAEIQNVEMAKLNVKTVLAENPQTSLQMLRYYPGLLKLKSSAEDALRSADIQANAERAKLAQSLSPKEYFQKLGIHLTYGINRPEQMPRVAELFGKTNQFILTYARYKESDVKDFMCSENKSIVTIHMADNLSDSGIIAILAVHKNENNDLVLDELTVSCRALGRNLENIMLPELFRLAREKLHSSDTILINYQKGDRNTPALNWLKNLTGSDLKQDKGTMAYTIPKHIDLSGLIVEVF